MSRAVTASISLEEKLKLTGFKEDGKIVISTTDDLWCRRDQNLMQRKFELDLKTLIDLETNRTNPFFHTQQQKKVREVNEDGSLHSIVVIIPLERSDLAERGRPCVNFVIEDSKSIRNLKLKSQQEERLKISRDGNYIVGGRTKNCYRTTASTLLVPVLHGDFRIYENDDTKIDIDRILKTIHEELDRILRGRGIETDNREPERLEPEAAPAAPETVIEPTPASDQSPDPIESEPEIMVEMKFTHPQWDLKFPQANDDPSGIIEASVTTIRFKLNDLRTQGQDREMFIINMFIMNIDGEGIIKGQSNIPLCINGGMYKLISTGSKMEDIESTIEFYTDVSGDRTTILKGELSQGLSEAVPSTTENMFKDLKQLVEDHHKKLDRTTTRDPNVTTTGARDAPSSRPKMSEASSLSAQAQAKAKDKGGRSRLPKPPAVEGRKGRTSFGRRVRASRQTATRDR